MLAVLVMAIFSTEVVLLGRLIMRQSINRQSRDWVSRSVCYWRLVNYSITPAFVRYWTNSEQRSILAPDRLSAFDPTATLAVPNGSRANWLEFSLPLLGGT